MQAGESIRRSLLYHLFRNGELVGTSGKQGGWFARVPFPPPIFLDVFVVSGSSTTHSSDRQVLYPLGYVCCGTLPPTTLRSLPSSPWAQPSGRFLFVQIDLCTGLWVCLPCPVHLLPLRDPDLLTGQLLKGFPGLSQAEFLPLLRRCAVSVCTSVNSSLTLSEVKSWLC